MSTARLGDKITALSLLKFTWPTAAMMLFTSTYVIVDGIFIARYVSTDALAASNIAYPWFNILWGISIMIASGGSALCATKFGAGKSLEARQHFSMLISVAFIIGVILSAIGWLFNGQIAVLLGANEQLMSDVCNYIKSMSVGVPLMLVMNLMQFFYVIAGKPQIGLGVTLFGGCTNILLDYIFMGPLAMGIVGAGLATALGMMIIPAIIGLIFFSLRTKEQLHFTRFRFRFRPMVNVCVNGSSEMVSNLSIAVTTFLFNYFLLKLAGTDGVAAITAILYISFLMASMFIGYSNGMAPMVSYNQGSKNYANLHKILKLSLIFILASSVIIFGYAQIFCTFLTSLFAPKGSSVQVMTSGGLVIFAFSFLFSGMNIFFSGFFTALSNGKISATISFMRTLFFTVIALVTLPNLLGVIGVWLAVPVAEVITWVISLIIVLKQRKRYHY